MKRLALMIAIAVLLPGCAVQALSYAAGAYCAAPEPARQANRILVNASIAPNRIEVTCGRAP
ncbi:hypothetical protein NRB16_08145 [Pseudomonas sp. LJDD11]|uniref:hypothetical protein n=1 Tax=Pseudomonas sp. LJDD11 TaxID=2931984 RepID=UPI00211BF060|nr:hypothetical protein [Pseudomonas sp. LJDD11]MCQ9423491.1 hypothetical protein [Pseudomonas sp. LJDD11]